MVTQLAITAAATVIIITITADSETSTHGVVFKVEIQPASTPNLDMMVRWQAVPCKPEGTLSKPGSAARFGKPSRS